MRIALVKDEEELREAVARMDRSGIFRGLNGRFSLDGAVYLGYINSVGTRSGGPAHFELRRALYDEKSCKILEEVPWQARKQFRKVGAIIREDEGRRYVVPSAPGKRFDGDYQGHGYALRLLPHGGNRAGILKRL